MRPLARHFLYAIALVAGVLASSPAQAARPLTTEDTGTLDPGDAELELSADYVRDGRADLFLLPGGPGLNIGLAPRLEGTIATAVVLAQPKDGPSHAGIGDLLVRLKYRFIDETSHVPALLGSLGVRLPTGDEDRGLGEPGVDVQALAVASKTFGAVTTTVNAGYTFVTRDRSLDVVNLTASAEAALTSAWSVVAEVVSELATSRRGDDRLIVRAGGAYVLTERVRLDAAAAIGVTRTSPDVLLTIGITVTSARR